MKPETIDTITRHLKGIVAALEKEKELPVVYKGKIQKQEGLLLLLQKLNQGKEPLIE